MSGLPVESNTELLVERLNSAARDLNPELSLEANMRLFSDRGFFVMPAFRDGHCHPLFAARELAGPIVTGKKSVAEIQGVVSDYARDNPDESWLIGGAYDRSLVEGGKFLATWLDQVCPDRPVVLHASDHHTIWVNSLALQLGEVASAVGKIEGIDVDPSGLPSGVLREPEAMNLVLSKIPELDEQTQVDQLRGALKHLLGLGIVECQDAWINPGMAEIYLSLARSNSLPITVHMAFRAPPESWQQILSYAIGIRETLRTEQLEHLHANTVKFFMDGVFGSATAHVLDPYLGHDAPHPNGSPVWNIDQLREAAAAFDRAGFQLHLHAIGDAGIRSALDVIESLGERNSQFSPVIAHCELIDDADLPRFAKLGVIANMQPLWAQLDGMLQSCIPHLGPERIDRMYPMKSLISSGATVSFGSDWPVSSPDPLLGISTAISRQTSDGKPEGGWVPSESISFDEAVTAYSSKVHAQLRAARSTTYEIVEPVDFLVFDSSIVPETASQVRDLNLLAVIHNAKIEKVSTSG